MPRRRIHTIFLIFLAAFVCILSRLFYIQVIDGVKFSREASLQRMADLQVDKARGDILDKNSIPLTNRTDKITVVIKPLMLRNKEEQISKICSILGLNYDKTLKDINTKHEPILVETGEAAREVLLNLNYQGVSVVNSLKRYSSASVARHVLGYLNAADQIGETGIEKAYQDILKLNMENYVGVITDARNNLVKGMGYRLKSPGTARNRLNVRLTIDYHIQKIVEDIMNSNALKGAVVVENVYNGDIAAMASKPDFDQNNVSLYLNSTKNELFNKAVASYNIGSIFKIIDLAEAFETNIDLDEAYLCTGSIKIGDREFKCTSYEKGGHGIVDLKQAFALSCNPYFINLGLKIKGDKILDMAREFGLGTVTGIQEQGIDESGGKLPAKGTFLSYGDIANIAIGQGDVLATPLQAADMAATVANGGIKNKINIVDCIVDDAGNKVRNLRRDEGIRIISKETADRIRELMEEVTNTGTGVRANLAEYGGAGGKTGSAETGQYINGKKVIHAWFVGYFPKKAPQYAISVFVENGKNGGTAAAPIFEEIAKEISLYIES